MRCFFLRELAARQTVRPIWFHFKIDQIDAKITELASEVDVVEEAWKQQGAAASQTTLEGIQASSKMLGAVVEPLLSSFAYGADNVQTMLLGLSSRLILDGGGDVPWI